MKLLILTGKFGMGHYSAANSLKEQIERVNPQAEAVVRDFFDYAMPACSGSMYRAFGIMVTRCSGAYNTYYNRMEKKGPDMRPAMLPYFVKKMKRLMDEERPDAVISTLPICSQVVSWMKTKYGDRTTLITCITDISSHSEWINAHTDCYLVPTRSVRQKLMEKGVDGSLIFLYGIPVKPEFDDVLSDGAADSRKKILIMGGGLGILPENPEFYKALNQCRQVKVTVITGKNKEIYRKLHGKYDKIDVIGYTDQVYRYMKEADVVISKPGGITLFETIHSGTPILVFEPFLQQEINNTGFIIRNGIGMILEKNPRNCAVEISQIIQDDTLLNRMRENVRQLKQEYDPGKIIQVLSLIGDRNSEVCAD